MGVSPATQQPSAPGAASRPLPSTSRLPAPETQQTQPGDADAALSRQGTARATGKAAPRARSSSLGFWLQRGLEPSTQGLAHKSKPDSLPGPPARDTPHKPAQPRSLPVDAAQSAGEHRGGGLSSAVVNGASLPNLATASGRVGAWDNAADARQSGAALESPTHQQPASSHDLGAMLSGPGQAQTRPGSGSARHATESFQERAVRLRAMRLAMAQPA